MCKIQEQSLQTGYSPSELIGASQKEELCLARFLCWSCLMWKEKKSKSSIGKLYNRSHSTIINGLRVIDTMSNGRKHEELTMSNIHHPKLRAAISRHKCFCTNGDQKICI